MDVEVITHAENGEISKKTEHITGVQEAELVGKEKWRKFVGPFMDRTEKEINLKDGKKLRQVNYINKDEQDRQLVIEVWSPTDDAILAADHTAKRDSEIYYEVVTNDYGTKFKVKAIKLQDGTWSAPKAKDRWQKGNIVNNRALAVQAAAGLFQGTGDIDPKENDKVIEIVLATADKLYEWINKPQ